MEPPPKRQRTPIVQLRDLNKQFAGWIAEQQRSHLDDLWIDGAEDYIQHARALLREAAGASNTAADAAKTAGACAAAVKLPTVPAAANDQTALGTFGAFGAAPAPGWGFPQLPAEQPAPKAAESPAPAGSVFSRLGPAAGSAGAPLFSPIGTAAPAAQPAGAAAPSFLANGASLPEASSVPAFQLSHPFQASSQPAPASAVSAPFSFAPLAGNGGAGAFAWAGSTAGTAAKAEGEEEEGPPEFKAEVQLAAGAKLLFKEPAKLFIRNTAKGAWDDRGQGTLTVRQQEEEGGGEASSTQVVFTMESGRILVNSAVYRGIKPQQAKKPTMVMVNLTLASDPGEDEQPKATLHAMLIRFGAEEKAASFIATVEGAVPK